MANNLFGETPESIRKYIYRSDDEYYKELLYSQLYFEDRRRKEFPQFTKYFDVIKFICLLLQDIFDYKIFEDRCKRYEELDKKFNQILEKHKTNKEEYVKYISDPAYQELNRIGWYLNNQREDILKKKNDSFETDIDKIHTLIDEFHKNPEKYLHNPKVILLREIENIFTPHLKDFKDTGYFKLEHFSNKTNRE